MVAFYDWHLVRTVLFLLAVCLFALYAIVVGAWQSRSAKRQTNRMTEQDDPLSVNSKMARNTDDRATELQRAWREERSVAGPARRAA